MSVIEFRLSNDSFTRKNNDIYFFKLQHNLHSCCVRPSMRLLNRCDTFTLVINRVVFQNRFGAIQGT